MKDVRADMREFSQTELDILNQREKIAETQQHKLYADAVYRRSARSRRPDHR